MSLSLIVQIISTIAMSLGILFGILNLRNFQIMRKREAAILMLNSFQTPDFVRGLLLIFSFRDGITKEEIDSLPKDQFTDFYMTLGAWERLGILVYRREIDIAFVDDAYSGPILISWKKLEAFIGEFRVSAGRDTGFEWFQWLAERMAERELTATAIPAYIAHKKWK